MIKNASQNSAIKVIKEGNGRGSFWIKKSFLSYKIFVLNAKCIISTSFRIQRERERVREREPGQDIIPTWLSGACNACHCKFALSLSMCVYATSSYSLCVCACILRPLTHKY